jgi:PAS domain S-box-containing protein
MNAAQQLWLEQVGTVLETLNQGVIINDESKRIVFANSMFLEMIKMRSSDLLGHSIVDLYPTEDVPRLLEFITRRETHGRASYEFYIPQADGGRLPVAVTSRQVLAVDGQPFGVVTATDIRALKQTEARLLEANAQLEQRHREIEEELLLAARVQQSLAPSSLTWGSVSVDTFYQAARTIGGDFGLVASRANELTVLVCDVSGHGISSALIANRIYTEAISQMESGVGLTVMMQHLNHFVMRSLAGSVFFFTFMAARLNRGSWTIELAGAGHPPAMIVSRGQKPRLLESRSAILGLLEDAVDAEATLQVPVRSGDRLIIYTDGLTESFNSEQEMLGVEGLKEIVYDTARMPLPIMKQEIIDRVTAWRSGPAVDDMSLVVLEIGLAGSPDSERFINSRRAAPG